MTRKPSYEELKQKVRDLEQALQHRNQVEKSLRESEKKYHDLLDLSPDPIAIIQSNRHVFINQAHTKLFGYTIQDVENGLNQLQLVPEEDHKKVIRHISERIKGKKPKSKFTTMELLTKDGKKIPCESAGSFIYYNGQPADLVIIRDITERKRTEDALRESKQFLSTVFDSIQDGISVLDSGLNIIRVNKTMKEWYAHMVPLEGKKCYEAYHGRTGVCDICPVVRALDSGKLEMNVVPLTQEVGVTGALELFAFPMLNDSGKPTRVVEYVRDISGRKQAEDALREAELIYRTVADFTHDWEYWLGLDGTLHYISPSVYRITGYQSQEFIDNPALLREIVVSEDRETYDKHRHDSINEQKLREIQFRVMRRDGEICWIEHVCTPVKDHDERPLGFRASNRDISDRKKAERALKEYAEKIKLFAYSVSHDLKNPAIGIHLLTKALHKKYRRILDEKGKHYCELILKGSEELATLVEQINVYISTKELPLTIEPVKLNQLLDIVRDGFSTQVLVRQISWTQPKTPVEINMDRLAVLRVLRNFVDNALKYGGNNLSEIKLGYEESDKFHILSVEDDGIGINEGDSEKIFGLFQRTLTARGIEGSGLGLAIASEIAEQHKGQVWAEPGREKGAIFYISISKDIRLTS